jgi:hypothetical protein
MIFFVKKTERNIIRYTAVKMVTAENINGTLTSLEPPIPINTKRKAKKSDMKCTAYFSIALSFVENISSAQLITNPNVTIR